MHLEILVEDLSGKKALDIIVPKIIDPEHTFRVISYKGVGRIPRNLNQTGDARKRILLEQLPRLLRGYGKAYPDNYPASVIVVCDLDSQDCASFRAELLNVLNACHPSPRTRFCIAIEEGEAWLLGDIPAIKAAYPQAKDSVLNTYKNDSICGSWECLANAICKGGAVELINKGWQAVGAEKSQWAEKISPHMKVEANLSPSFNYFRKKLIELTI